MPLGHKDLLHEPGSPWENPFAESFNGRSRDELLNIEEFANLFEARVVVEAWRIEYNTYRPHSSLGRLTPAEFKRHWIDQHQTCMLIAGGSTNGTPAASSLTKPLLGVGQPC